MSSLKRKSGARPPLGGKNDNGPGDARDELAFRRRIARIRNRGSASWAPDWVVECLEQGAYPCPRCGLGRGLDAPEGCRSRLCPDAHDMEIDLY